MQKINVLGWLVSEGYISPAFARGLEALILGILLSGLIAAAEYLQAALTSGAPFDPSVLAQGVALSFLSAVTMGVKKALRDAAIQAAAAAKEKAEALQAEASK